MEETLPIGVKLNLGSGQNPLAGYINVDKFGSPDVQCDLEQFPWPWEDSTVAEIVMNHVLEHVGESTSTFLGIIKELYRVCANNGRIVITVPHPRSDDFLNDPTHVRPITPAVMKLFSKKKCLDWKERGCANSPLALYLNVDMEVEAVRFDLTEPWLQRMRIENLTPQQLEEATATYNNVVKQTKITMRVIK